MKHVLILCDYYLPGHKAGGPIRSISNLIAALQGEFRFSVVTRDRDLGDQAPYPGVATGRFQTFSGSTVMHLPSGIRGLVALRRVLGQTAYDVLYLNSLLSPGFTIPALVLRRLGRIPRVPVILAPRGELSPGALGLSPTKKSAYFRLARWAALYRGLTWQASSDHEREDILRFVPASEVARVQVVPPLAQAPTAGSAVKDLDALTKRPGELDLVFLARISPMKNLEGAIEALAGVVGRVQLNIYGPREDPHYWSECERKIAGLPRHVSVAYRGAVAPADVGATLARHDALLLPTRGENFGHVILEALLAGCPVLISDRTPWRGLADSGAGFDVPLDQPAALTRALQTCIDLDAVAFRRMCQAARNRGTSFADDPRRVEPYRALFNEAL